MVLEAPPESSTKDALVEAVSHLRQQAPAISKEWTESCHSAGLTPPRANLLRTKQLILRLLSYLEGGIYDAYYRELAYLSPGERSAGFARVYLLEDCFAAQLREQPYFPEAMMAFKEVHRGFIVEGDGLPAEKPSDLGLVRGVIEIVGHSVNLEDVLEGIIRRLLEAGKGEVGEVLLLNDDNGTLVSTVSVWLGGARETRRKTIKVGEGSPGLAFAAGRAVVGDRLGNRQADRHLSSLLPAIGSYICVPVVCGGKRAGVLVLASAEALPYQQDTGLLETVGYIAGLAVEKTNTHRELQRREQARRQLLEKVISAQEEERKRIARELHDETGQALTALIMSLAAVEDSLPTDMVEIRERLSWTKSLTNTTLEEIRKLMFDLRPTLLDDLGLVPALRWYVKTYSERLGLDIRLETSGVRGRLPAETETVLFRIVQEAITNIARHAAAGVAKVRLELKGSVLMVTVEDDGRGFVLAEVTSSRARGLGLQGMEERTELLGGTFRINSRLGKGTKITIQIPYGQGG